MIVFLAGALAVLLLFMLVHQPLSDSGVSPGHVVRTVNGSYAGLHLREYNQHVFLGIPYATPPLGQLRFRRSEPFSESWDGVRNATEYGPTCPGYGVRHPLSSPTSNPKALANVS